MGEIVTVIVSRFMSKWAIRSEWADSMLHKLLIQCNFTSKQECSRNATVCFRPYVHWISILPEMCKVLSQSLSCIAYAFKQNFVLEDTQHYFCLHILLFLPRGHAMRRAGHMFLAISFFCGEVHSNFFKNARVFGLVRWVNSSVLC